MKEFKELIGHTATVVYRENPDSNTIGIKGKIIEGMGEYIVIETSKGRVTLKVNLIEIIKEVSQNE